MKKFTKNAWLIGMLCLAAASCTKELQNSTAWQNSTLKAENTTSATAAAASPYLTETFESGSKSGYATGSVSLGSGSWTLNDALIGNTSADAKAGSYSARIRNTGSLTTNFNIAASGTVSISISHAAYGTDGSSTWQLFVSTDGGNTYTQTGTTVTSSSTSLQTVTFQTDASGSLRLSVRKVSGASNRINIDNITVAAGDGTTTPTTPSDPGTGTGSTTGDDSNLLLGNPSGAVSGTGSPNNYLMEKPYYTVSYSRDRGTPNWVSWHVQASDLGSVSRSDDFRADTSLPSGWYAVQTSSYSGSGFDRGHNCPSGDRTSSSAANSATFLMTNMIPQAPNNNQKGWATLENYTRSLVTAGSEVYVICGSYGQGGTGSSGGVTNTIDNGNVTVPSQVWKIIVVLPNGNNDLSRITATTRVIAVNTPNSNSIGTDWKAYRTSVSSIEAVTGYSFFSNVPAAVRTALKQQVDNQ